MALALEMGLDPEADRAIRDLWSRLEQLGVPSLEGHVPSIRPHLSLTVTDDADGLRQHAPGLALRGVETEIEMAAVSLFPADPPVLVLAVAPAPSWSPCTNASAPALAAAGVDIWPHYRPGTWLPHCTLSMGVPADALAEALAACLALAVAAARPSSRGRSDRLRHRSDDAAVTRLTAYVSALVALDLALFSAIVPLLPQLSDQARPDQGAVGPAARRLQRRGAGHRGAASATWPTAWACAT